MRYILKFYRFLRTYKRRMAVFMVATTLTVVVESLRPYWLKQILESAGVNDMPKVWEYLALFGVSTIGGNWLSALAFYLSDKILIPLSREIRETVFLKVMELDFAYHVEKNTGSLISAFRRGDGAVFNIFWNIHNELYRVMIYLVVTLYFLSTVSWEMVAIMVGLFGGNLVIIWWLVKQNLHTRTEFNKSEDEVAGVIADGMINYETVKFFAAEKKERSRLSFKFNDWLVKFWNHSNSFRIMDIVIGTTSGSGMLLIMSLALKKLGQGFSVGDLIMVSGFVTGFYYQFFNLFFRIRDIAKSMTDLEKYLDILDQEVRVKDPKRSKVVVNPRGEVIFRNIGFVYPKNKQKILSGINLKIKSGENVALVGRSGAGKTTLVKLLLRFYDPSVGVIEIDGVNIKQMKKSDLRKLMGVVPQEPIMFNNTIKFNLSYGNDEASMEEIREAARKANILEFIEGLPGSWETEVGERGIKLSGGQKQRLAIARALLSNPKILVFDEATSNLDSESEKQIQAALGEAAKSRTVIVIAHRFSTIRNADKIVVLSNGEIVETGKHDELLKKDGIYKRLWILQSKWKLKYNDGLISK